MSDRNHDSSETAFETRSRARFRDSVAGIDFATRSRLTRARHAALKAAGTNSRTRFLRLPLWKPAAGVAAAALLGITLWFGPLSGNLSGNHAATGDNQTNLEDLDIVASSDLQAGSDSQSGDAIEMLQDDLDFYDFADKAANPGPAA